MYLAEISPVSFRAMWPGVGASAFALNLYDLWLTPFGQPIRSATWSLQPRLKLRPRQGKDSKTLELIFRRTAESRPSSLEWQRQLSSSVV